MCQDQFALRRAEGYEPPVILKSLPENGTVEFTGKSFSITFDEFVVLDRITEKFMVSLLWPPSPR
jgi:hypothetical protein